MANEDTERTELLNRIAKLEQAAAKKDTRKLSDWTVENWIGAIIVGSIGAAIMGFGIYCTLAQAATP